MANIALGEAGTNVTSPVSGVVVRWRVEGARGGPFELRVLTPGTGGSYTGAGTSNPQMPASTATQTYTTELPIRAGQTVGLDLTRGPTTAIGFAMVSGSTAAFWYPGLADGSTAPSTAQDADTEIEFNADVVAQPGVSAVSPPSGPVSGGTHVVVQGHDFTGATAVSFGGHAAAGFTVDSDSQISAVAPGSATRRSVDVTVTTQGGTSPTSASDRFTYVACVVPKLERKKLKKARKLLKAAHCSLGKVKKAKHQKGKLVVKSQSSPPGTVLADGASVSIKLGPKPHHKKRH